MAGNAEHAAMDGMGQALESAKPMPPDAKPKFEVVTVKRSDPDRTVKTITSNGRHVLTTNTTVSELMAFAYGLHPKQIVGAPAWFGTDKFDIDGVPDVEGEPNGVQFKMLLQSVLVERFGLTFHLEQRELSVFVLTVAKSGAKLTESGAKPSDPAKSRLGRQGELTMTNATMQDLCDRMQGGVLDRPMLDRTGLTGRYDLHLRWTPDESQFGQAGTRLAPTDDPNAPPDLYKAMQENLGLKLEATRTKAEVRVIDHAEKLSAN